MSELHVKIGKLLRLERERQGIALGDLSTSLKITLGHLEYIEAGDLEALPSELYFNLFAKSYAEALGINYTATVDAIKEDIGQPLEPQVRVRKEKREGPAPPAAVDTGETETQGETSKTGNRLQRRFMALFAIVVGLFLILLAVNSLFFDRGDPKPAAETSADVGPTNVSTSRREVTGDARFSAFDWKLPEYRKPSDLRLKLVAKEASWATVRADGDTAIFRTLVPGKTYLVSAKYRLQVSVAVPSAVDIELNGKPVNLRNPNSRRISRVEITQINLDSILSPPERAGDTSPKSEGKPAADLTGEFSSETASANQGNAVRRSTDSVAEGENDDNER